MLAVNQALDIINHNKKVAIVGLSPKEDRPSNQVARFLIDKGFDIVPVNPVHKEILGKPCVKNLSDLSPGEVDWIDMFVNPQKLMEFADDAVRLSPKLVWCQIGVVNEEFNGKMEAAHIPYIADVCPKIELNKVAKL